MDADDRSDLEDLDDLAAGSGEESVGGAAADAAELEADLQGLGGSDGEGEGQNAAAKQTRVKVEAGAESSGSPAAAAAGSGSAQAAGAGDPGHHHHLQQQQQQQQQQQKLALEKIEEVTRLRQSAAFKRQMDLVQAAGPPPEELNGALEEHPEYTKILGCNSLITHAADDMAAVHRHVVALFEPRFPELKSLIVNPLEYVRVAGLLGNETDLSKVDLASILPASQLTVISIANAANRGRPLTAPELQRLNDAVAEMEALQEARSRMLDFVASRMTVVAPNMAAMVGPPTAAQLMGLAGGLAALAATPSCNVQVMGQKKKSLNGMSAASIGAHQGIIFEAPLFQQCPKRFGKKLAKVLAAKLVLAARVDLAREWRDGAEGRRLLGVVEARLKQWVAPPPARMKKALPKPEEKKSTKRGGRKVRAKKERTRMSEMRKLSQRVSFAAPAAAEYGDDAMGLGTGVLGMKGSGITRIQRKNKRQTTEKERKAQQKEAERRTSGLESSLVFTPVTGMELVNPTARQKQIKEANSKWFGRTGFAHIGGAGAGAGAGAGEGLAEAPSGKRQRG